MDDRLMAAAVMLTAGAALGLLMFVNAIQGMRRGAYQYRRSWFYRREDGIMFWFMTVHMAGAGLMMVVCCCIMAWRWFGE